MDTLYRVYRPVLRLAGRQLICRNSRIEDVSGFRATLPPTKFSIIVPREKYIGPVEEVEFLQKEGWLYGDQYLYLVYTAANVSSFTARQLIKCLLEDKIAVACQQR